jgi:Amt family ammonium transporter
VESQLEALQIIFTEFYYWVTVVFMFFIHVGFCMYEVGATREKNKHHTLMKNTMVIPLVSLAFYYFGWWIYFAWPNGPWITGPVLPAPWATPWSELMATHMGGPPVQAALTAADTAGWARINGVFWAAFLLFSWTVASIVSGACIERIRSGAFWILAVMVGSFTWIIDAAWGWHPDGWMIQLLGYHDAYASGVIHAIGGGACLGILVNLGPRIGKFAPDGTPRDIPGNNVWLTTIGLFLILCGFWGFYVACNIPMFDVQAGDGVFFSATNIYLAPTTLSAITFNFIMSMSGGFMAAYVISKGDPFWTYSGYLAGIIAASAGNDLYTPIQAFLIGCVGAVWAYKLHYWVERKFKIDDPVGACAVHGYTGWLGVVIAGFMLWGYPSSPNGDYAHISPWGNLIGAFIMWGVLGFLPAYILSKFFKMIGWLRVPKRVELMGLDFQSNLEYDRAVAEILESERAEARASGYIK